ncbi:RNase H domain-containing protein [Trichonephila clavipes]|nr:RNase H domain-containing protein [Trichonephila clavipes]
MSDKILSDSRSSLQHLHNWTQVGDKTSISILHNLKLISKHHDVHFQWIPSHVDIFGNEQADRLAREGCSLLTTSSPAITYSEHQSKINRQLSKEWKIPLSLTLSLSLSLSLPPTTGMRPGNRALFWISTATEHLKRPFPDWPVDTRKVSPSLRAGRLLSSAPSARFSRPLPNISWTVWVFPEKTCTILPFLLSIF